MKKAILGLVAIVLLCGASASAQTVYYDTEGGRYIDKSNRKEWIVGFTLKEPIWDRRGLRFAFRQRKGTSKNLQRDMCSFKKRIILSKS